MLKKKKKSGMKHIIKEMVQALCDCYKPQRNWAEACWLEKSYSSRNLQGNDTCSPEQTWN